MENLKSSIVPWGGITFIADYYGIKYNISKHELAVKLLCDDIYQIIQPIKNGRTI